MAVGTLALISSPILATPVFAATTTSKVKVARGHVRAQVNGQSLDAISVGTDTYVDWHALSILHTPNSYLGDGKFVLTKGTVQGVIYHGTTYIPWTDLADKVKATSLKGGGFNFTSVPVKHAYHIEIDTQDAPAGSPAPLQVIVYDGQNPVPSQSVTISTTGASTLTGSAGVNQMTAAADSTGTWIGGVNDATQETVYPTVSWTTPTGTTVKQTASITFGTPTDLTQTVAPANDTVVASTTSSTFQNAILFNAKSGNDNVLMQLDTGSFEPLFTKADAQLLGLPNLGNIQVAGIGGSDNAYVSQVSLNIGGVEFTNVPCIVDDSYTGVSLFGYGFFTDNGYDLLISQKNNSISILK